MSIQAPLKCVCNDFSKTKSYFSFPIEAYFIPILKLKILRDKNITCTHMFKSGC